MVVTDGVHLLGSTEEELHEFAKRLGFRREWFQGQSRYPHYDLTTTNASRRAVAAGAVMMTSRGLLTWWEGSER